MTQIELKKKLWEYPQLEDKLKDVFSEIAAINARADTLRGVKSPVLSGLPHITGPGDPTYKAAQLIIDEYDVQMNVLLDEVKRLEIEIRTIKRLLKRITDEELKVIEIHYFNHVRWDYVPAQVYRSRSSCFILRDSAIRKMLA